MDLSFSGAGFMGCYYFGIANCWNKYIPRERVRRVAGASAGSLIAAYYLMDLPLETCLRMVIEMTEDIRKRPLGVFDRSNQMVDILPKLLDQVFPQNAHKRVNGRLFVSMTRLKDMKSIIVSQFDTRKDLIDALNCSCFIPVWSGNHVSTYKGVKHIDGGFTNNMPAFDEHTIRISSFAGPSDIAPYDRRHTEKLQFSFKGMPFYVTLNNFSRMKRALWPPPPGYIIELLELGYQDAKNFILSNDLIQCDKCFGQLEEAHEPIYSRLKNPTISPGCSPAVSRASSHVNLAELQRSASFRSARSLLGAASNQKADDRGQRRLKQRRDSLSSSGDSSSSGVDSMALSEVLSSEQEARKAPTKASLSAMLRSKLNALKLRRPKKGAAERAPSILVQTPGELEHQCKHQLPAIQITVDAESPSSSEAPSPSLEVKVRRAELNPRRRESLPQNGFSPLDRFVRRMSATPEQFLKQTGEFSDQTEPNNNNIDDESGALLGAAHKFAMAPSPLPSCPPSPNLNRHCDECIRMRHQARLDLIDEAIMKQAQLYQDMNADYDPEREFAHLAGGGGIKSKLARWLRFLAGQKTSQAYSFEEPSLQKASEIPTIS